MTTRAGSLLIELAVALSIGMVVLLQLTTFVLAFVQQMHGIAGRERRMLQEGVVIDLLMQDIATSIEQQPIDPYGAGISLQCWRLRDGQKAARLISIVWKKAGQRVQRHVDGLFSPQVFGDLLQDLVIDCVTRTVRFIDEEKKLRTYSF